MLNKISLAVFSLVVGVVGYTNLARAAADADFASGTDAITAVGTDNKTAIIGFIAAIVVFLLIVGLSKGAMLWGKRAVSSIFGGRRRRR